MVRKFSHIQKKKMKGRGFGSILDLKVHSVPNALGYWIIKNYDSKTKTLNVGTHIIKITAKLVHEILGIPMETQKVVELVRATDTNPIVLEWRRQYIGARRLYVKEVTKLMEAKKDDGWKFMLNFLVVYNSVFGEYLKSGVVNQKCFTSIDKKADIKSMDW
ncbi:hypothetical protein QVD17_39617 [Tagetes erecta]|uniref:Uncharacterized protein n=1 Tax=Tagetes erecta TaxID=13708 RepID=A0AAD8NH97_TARER|nr:hypothetical protein QVD17_39617 [Tagetes erecta]